MHLSRERIAPVAAAFGAGVALGLSGPLAGKFDHPVCAALNAVFAAGWPWACFAFLVGYVRRSRIESALLSSSALAVGVVVYYVFKALSPAAPIGVEVTGGPVTGSLSGSSSMILFWGQRLSSSARRWDFWATSRAHRVSAASRSGWSFPSSPSTRPPCGWTWRREDRHRSSWRPGT